MTPRHAPIGGPLILPAPNPASLINTALKLNQFRHVQGFRHTIELSWCQISWRDAVFIAR